MATKKTVKRWRQKVKVVSPPYGPGGTRVVHRQRTFHLTSQREWARYMPGGAFKRPFHENEHPRYPKGHPLGGRWMQKVNG